MVISGGLEEFFHSDWSEVFGLGLGHVDFQSWVFPVDSAHYDLRLFFLPKVNKYTKGSAPDKILYHIGLENVLTLPFVAL